MIVPKQIRRLRERTRELTKKLRPFRELLIGGPICLVLLVSWHVFLAIYGSADDEEVDWIKSEGGAVTRWSQPTLWSLVQAYNEKGNVEAVQFADHDAVAEKHIEVLLRLQDCQRIMFVHCRFVDNRVIARLNGMDDIDWLELIDCGITDQDVSVLLSLTRLKYLIIKDAAMTDNAIAELSKMNWLRLLVVEGTQISPDGIMRLKLALQNSDVRTSLRP